MIGLSQTDIQPLIDFSTCSCITHGSFRCCESHPVYCTQKKHIFSAYIHLHNENLIDGTTYRKTST